MTKLDAVRRTIEEIGEVSPEELARQVQERFSIVISVPFVPVFLATIRAQRELREPPVADILRQGGP